MNKVIISGFAVAITIAVIVTAAYFILNKENFERNLISDEILKGNFLDYYDKKPIQLQKSTFNLKSW